MSTLYCLPDLPEPPEALRKSFLINLPLTKVWSTGDIALSTASSGIAATLLHGGRTAHSTFKLPLDLTRDEVPVCNLNADSAMGEVLRQCKFIVWDECTMAHRHALEAVDITLKDCRQDQRPMGGVVLLMAGDFRQILPIIPRGTIADELHACLKASPLWSFVERLTLSTNMRAVNSGDPNSLLLSQFLLQLGSGQLNDTDEHSGMPPYHLELRVGVPIILLRNIDAPRLCNGTPLCVKRLWPHVVEATILTGCFQNEEVFIPRIPLIHDDKHSPLHFKRLQFPIRVSFAMSINKAQEKHLRMFDWGLKTLDYRLLARLSQSRSLFSSNFNPYPFLPKELSVYGEECMSIQMIRRWRLWFLEGRQNLPDDERSGSPVTATDNAAVASVRNVVEADRRVTIDEIMIRLPPGIEIRRSSIGTIMSVVLNFLKVCTRWVPRLLLENHKQQRKEAARAFLEMHQRDGDQLFSRIVTGDERWVHHSTPETKRQSMVWKKPEESAPKKAQNMARIRPNETPGETSQRLLEAKQSMAVSRANETQGETSGRLLKARQYKAIRRANETTEVQINAVDAYTKMEASRLHYIKTHQSKLRVDLYESLRKNYNHHNTEWNQIGNPIILPSSFIGSSRNMQERYRDTMAIVRKYGKPDLFITMTCNPKWLEITENLNGSSIVNRPDIVSRVFNLKSKELIRDLIKNQIFGKVVAYVYTIEFQKRGLPHMHLFCILDDKSKPNNSELIDKIIWAEIPEDNDPSGLNPYVLKHMIHGPCIGSDSGKFLCLDSRGKCKKEFPKYFLEETIANLNGYPKYQRRNTGKSFKLKNKNISVDNRWVVPYSPFLLKKYGCHINVQVCTSIKSAKYIFKYILKGHDCANLEIKYNEIKTYLNSRGAGKIVLPCASTGIAATLLKRGRTYHSLFKLPIPLNETSIANIDKDSNLKNEIISSSLIIWDEIIMAIGYALTAIDRKLRDVMRDERPFGGKVILFGGDFRQNLPVIKHGHPAQIIESTVKRNPLWCHVKSEKLTLNMRTKDEVIFAEYLLKVGEGELLNDYNLPQNIIEVPRAMISSGDLNSEIFGEKLNFNSLKDNPDRAILCPTNEDTFQINNALLDKLGGTFHHYVSINLIDIQSDNLEQDQLNYPVEFLNSITLSGMPQHKLNIKVGAIVILLKNVNTKRGLCNGTRMIVTELKTNLIYCEVLSGPAKNEIVYIPRIDCSSGESDYPFKIIRRQFPIRISFAMTINKSQGQTFNKNITIDLKVDRINDGKTGALDERKKEEAGKKRGDQAPSGGHYMADDSGPSTSQRYARRDGVPESHPGRNDGRAAAPDECHRGLTPTTEESSTAMPYPYTAPESNPRDPGQCKQSQTDIPVPDFPLNSADSASSP
ncbi:hypothetical protein LAZ67_2001639, partial [Cordylochernes scorpioides]